jgi:hypothetical protein
LTISKGVTSLKSIAKRMLIFVFISLSLKRADTMEIAALTNVSFVRYNDGDKYLDIKFISGKPYEFTSFEVISSDMSIKTVYELVNISKAIHGEQRLRISGREVIDESGDKVLGFYRFSYAKFDRDYTPLDMNPYLICDSSVVSNRFTYDKYWAAFNSAFIQ